MNEQNRFASLPRGDHRALCAAWVASEERAFGIHAAANGDLELSILDVIGEDFWSGGGITSKSIKQALDQHKAAKNIRVLINSPGGDVAEGMAIYNLLRAHPASVRTEVIGLAASAASWIVQAGDQRIVHQPGMMMIHGAWAITRGTAEDHAATAELLTKMNGEQIDLFSKRTGLAKDELTKMIAAETWMGSQECCDKGFADQLAEPGTAPESKAQRAPAGAQAINLEKVPPPPTMPEVILPPPAAASTVTRARKFEATEEELETMRQERIEALKVANIEPTPEEIAKAEKNRAVVLSEQPFARAARPPAPAFGGLRSARTASRR